MTSMAPKFTKDTATMATPSGVVIINRQPSRFGPEEFINIGIAYAALGIPAKLKEHTCHLRFRGDDLLDAGELRMVGGWITSKGKGQGSAVTKLLDAVTPLADLDALRAAYRQKPQRFASMLMTHELRSALEA